MLLVSCIFSFIVSNSLVNESPYVLRMLQGDASGFLIPVI